MLTISIMPLFTKAKMNHGFDGFLSSMAHQSL